MPGIYGFHHMVVRLEDFDAGVDCYTKLFPQGPSSTGENACDGRIARWALFAPSAFALVCSAAPAMPQLIAISG